MIITPTPGEPGSCDLMTTMDDPAIFIPNPNLPPRRSAYALPMETGLMVVITEWFAGSVHSHTTYELHLHREIVGVYERSAHAQPH